MTSSVIEYSPNLNLSLLPANFHVWAQIMNDNLITLDAGINAFVRFHNLRGPWTNSTAYALGDTVVDTSDATLWSAMVTHNSAQIPTTFLEERAERPTLWVPTIAPAVARGVWTGPGTLYNPGDFVLADGTKYAICLVQHISSASFDADAALGLWSILIDFSPLTDNSLVAIGPTPPIPAVDRQLWWSSDLGRLFVRYNDGNSSQWVATTPTVTDSSALLTIGTYTVVTLPSPVTAGPSVRAFVTDATVNTFHSIVVGGGTVHVPVFSDGVNWRIG